METRDLLIDGDILCYRSAAACDGRQYIITYANREGQTVTLYEKYKKEAEKIRKSLSMEGLESNLELVYEPEPYKNAKYLLEKSLQGLKDDIEKRYKIGKVRIFLSSGGSFREKECPFYKKNRADLRRPEHLEALKTYLVDKHGAEWAPGEFEADDLMAMNQGDTTIICSIDKDLLQVPGMHYNWVQDKWQEIDEEQGNRNLYMQMLMGDTSDGIPGIKGIGPVTAKKLLKDLTSPFMMYCVVLKTYIEKERMEEGESTVDFQMRMVATVRIHARLLYLLRSPQDSWEAPDGNKVRQ